jgi:hypothetical protein
MGERGPTIGPGAGVMIRSRRGSASRIRPRLSVRPAPTPGLLPAPVSPARPPSLCASQRQGTGAAATTDERTQRIGAPRASTAAAPRGRCPAPQRPGLRSMGCGTAGQQCTQGVAARGSHLTPAPCRATIDFLCPGARKVLQKMFAGAWGRGAETAVSAEQLASGEVAEWLNALVSKTSMGSGSSGVRIPPSPLRNGPNGLFRE